MASRNSTCEKDLRREARQRGLPWATVKEMYREVKQQEWEVRQHPNDVRATAWMMATGSRPGSWPFWRHGFYSRWGHKLGSDADYTIVPGYDEIAQQIASAFPEYAGHDGTARLFDFLFSPHDRFPTREEIYRKAMDRLEHETPGPAVDYSDQEEF